MPSTLPPSDIEVTIHPNQNVFCSDRSGGYEITVVKRIGARTIEVSNPN